MISNIGCILIKEAFVYRILIAINLSQIRRALYENRIRDRQWRSSN